MKTKEYKYKSFPTRVKPSGCENCKGHANYMLDIDYSNKDERELMMKILDNYIREK